MHSPPTPTPTPIPTSTATPTLTPTHTHSFMFTFRENQNYWRHGRLASAFIGWLHAAESIESQTSCYDRRRYTPGMAIGSRHLVRRLAFPVAILAVALLLHQWSLQQRLATGEAAKSFARELCEQVLRAEQGGEADALDSPAATVPSLIRQRLRGALTDANASADGDDVSIQIQSGDMPPDLGGDGRATHIAHVQVDQTTVLLLRLLVRGDDPSQIDVLGYADPQATTDEPSP